jgi:hypothetical protein
VQGDFAGVRFHAEYFHIEEHFLDQLAALGWTVVTLGWISERMT